MKGKLEVYEYYVAEITDWVKYEDGANKIMPTEMKTDVLLRKEGEDFVKLNDVRFLQFKKGMSKYLADCESVSKDIADKKLKRAHVWDIFEPLEPTLVFVFGSTVICVTHSSSRICAWRRNMHFACSFHVQPCRRHSSHLDFAVKT